MILAMAAALALQTTPAPPAAQEKAGQPATAAFTSYTAAFTTFVDETAAMPEQERVKLFRTRFNALFPGFYQPASGRTDEQYDATVAANLKAFPAIRDKYTAASETFAQAFTTGQARFRTVFRIIG